MRLLERSAQIVHAPAQTPLLDSLERGIDDVLPQGHTPVRLAVTSSANGVYECEIGVIEGETPYTASPLFGFRRREFESQSEFNVVFVVPTGIGAEIGGHAGDATPAAILMAQVADTLITHPNVVNASDINELPANGMYVEGSVLSRLMMGTVGLRAARSNRVLVALDMSCTERFAKYSMNAVNAARSTYGLSCAGIVRIDPPLRLVGAYTAAGRASGTVEGVSGLLRLLTDLRDTYDAVALASVVDVPLRYHYEYFTSGGEMVNPWGGVEALLTHAVSSILDVPAAHAPMMESDDISAVDPGIVDARMAAEIISITFLQSVLKGLQRAPRIETDQSRLERSDVLSAEDVSCLVIPDSCLGLPTLAALHQGIRVVAVRENRSLMRNDLASLPWASDQLYFAENYWEAAGIVAALRAGLDPSSVRRPISTMRVRNSDRADL